MTDAEREAELFRKLATSLFRALVNHGIHATSCQSYREIGRLGSRSGLQWYSTDEKTCSCGLGAAIGKATRIL